MSEDPIARIFLQAAANHDLIEVIQAYAFKEGRMASEMAPRAVATLTALAKGEEVSQADLEHTKQLLRFVSEGTLEYVDSIQESRGGRFP